MFNEREMILNPYKWPGDTLCLKKRPINVENTSITGYAAFGIITMQMTPTPITIYLRDIKNPARDFLNVVNYNSVDDLLADGWIVD